MAQGTYKSGEQINLTYQAVALLSNAIPVGTVYDEGGAVHSAETTGLTSALLAGEKADPADGRYHGHFTPDAEGRWTVVIKDKNGAGEVTKTYQVVGHNVDSIGDAVAGLGAGAIASQLLLTQSALDSMLLSKLLVTQSAVNVATASDALLKQSAIISSAKSDALVKQSAINTAIRSQVLLMISAISDVESAVDTISSPAAVS
jgi:hypothetical protein